MSYDIHHISCNHNAFYRPDKTILLILFVRGGAGHLDPFEPTKNGPRGPQMASKNGLFWSYLTTFGLADTFYFFATIFFLRCSKLGENGQRFKDVSDKENGTVLHCLFF